MSESEYILCKYLPIYRYYRAQILEVGSNFRDTLNIQSALCEVCVY